ncbi:MAG: HDIG domain-containing protein [Tannerellaceae bacterium]|nr:HDIG domain-containing protein [Tannerellaceae bacterium]
MKTKRFNIPVYIYFILIALIIGWFFPREGKFRYQFSEGKPWRYELLTAPSNFSIYKSDEEVTAERDSVMKAFRPYYRILNAVESEQVDKLRDDYKRNINPDITPTYMQYIENSLVKMYKNGIISPQDLETLNRDNYEEIKVLVDNTMAEDRYVADLFTVRTAYEFILNNAPSHLNKIVLQSCNINYYLTENLTYDDDKSEKAKEELLRSVSVSKGMVQAGERIVDRGEIVDNHTYHVLRSLRILHESRTGGVKRQQMITAGEFILVIGILLCFWLYLISFRPRILASKKNTIFLLLCILVSCLITEFCVSVGLFSVYILPYAIVPIVVRVFIDSRTSLFTHLVIILICSLMVPFPFEFLFMQMVAGMVVTFSLRDLSERSDLIRCAFYIYLSYAISYLSITLYMEGDWTKINWMMLLYFGINFILLMFTYILVYMLEKVFGYVSSITLIELSNTNSPVLQKLSEVAPATFQHSLQVSILASEAASRIGANAPLVRTGALYHDIGKMTNPAFFTENQKSVNPHDQLSLEESAQIIINHVTEGIKLAEKYKLPQEIINFIRTHHGSGKTKYFYNTFKNKFPDKEIDESKFTYPGPNPSTKETAILMMADAVEAASRSLKEHTEESIRKLVNGIIDSQIADGLMKNTPLTYRDVETIKDVFVERLKIMYHTRISYPELNKK